MDWLNSVRFVAATAAITMASAAVAEDYPSRPVTMSIGYAAGGSVDIVARIVAEALSEKLGQRVVVDNRPGASGMISADHVARSTPDGYTIGMVTTTQFATNPHLYSSIPYKISDFETVGMAVKAPIGVGISTSIPVGTVAEFQEYARANADEMSYGSFGLGTNSQLVNELMNETLGFRMEHVPYANGGLARTDLIAGNIHVLVDAIATLAPLHREGQIKLLANLNDTRTESAADVPTFVESGFPDLVAYTWFGIVAPAGTSAGVIDHLSGKLKEVIEDPAASAKLEEAAFIPSYSTAAELSEQIAVDYDRWGPIIQRLDIRLD